MLVCRHNIQIGATLRRVGEPIPEARTWPRLKTWLRTRKILEVPDELHAVLYAPDVAAALATGEHDGHLEPLMTLERQLERRAAVYDAIEARRAVVLAAQRAAEVPEPSVDEVVDTFAEVPIEAELDDDDGIDLAQWPALVELLASGSVRELGVVVHSGEHDAHLDALLAAERAGRDRSSLIKSIEARMRALAAAAERQEREGA